jgi:proteasome component ECM29
MYCFFICSLQTISQLVGSAGNLLKPHLPLLIPALLEATGELESRGLSELSAQFGAERQAQEVIDAVRASVAKSHYTTETVTKVISSFFYKRYIYVCVCTCLCVCTCVVHLVIRRYG